MTCPANTQARLALHGCIVTLLGLCAGIGFSWAAATADTASELYRNWKFAHVEGLMNGLLVLAVAGIWPVLERDCRLLALGRWLLIAGAYCNAIGPWLTALFIGHRVIQPHTALESFVVWGFYVPGTVPLLAFAIFIVTFLRKR